ncbi:photosynthetic protein synthase I [Pseudorhodoferax aquiterrae]|uniref:Photosynthetic protein synthase I n=1 Tax=Pseudorhodoferax aquiterrae TaxID=747304 RepID=A0ABQ3G862_9BURK|nr:SCO family protein [Pseudorhodoferax aquiterrae]GHC96553.1 photosynthetic protein synthase I [Pseudorhodoferax aquiterrae]
MYPSTPFVRPPALRRRGLLAAGSAALLPLLAGCQPAPPAFNGIDVSGADYGKDFRLQDPSGRTRTLADFKGQAVLLFFGFTQCPDVCPTALARAAQARALLGALGQRVQVVFVTVDPERDTPAVLQAYTSAFDPSFLGLHSTLEETAALAKNFKAHYKKVPTGSSYTMDHTALTYVYDPAGRLRVVLRHDQSAEQFAQDLRRLLA